MMETHQERAPTCRLSKTLRYVPHDRVDAYLALGCAMKPAQTLRVGVPCGGCTACCRNELVVLYPEDGDDLRSFDYDEVEIEDGSKLAVVKQRENGDCVYLGPAGCTIHERAPLICQHFDCRRYFLSMTRVERRMIEKVSRGKLDIFKAGRERAHTLSDEERRTAIKGRMARRIAVSDRQWLRRTAGLA